MKLYEGKIRAIRLPGRVMPLEKELPVEVCCETEEWGKRVEVKESPTGTIELKCEMERPYTFLSLLYEMRYENGEAEYRRTKAAIAKGQAVNAVKIWPKKHMEKLIIRIGEKR